MIGFDNGSQSSKVLDGRVVNIINPDLTAHADVTQARPLAANAGVSFQGPVKVGKFDIEERLALEFLYSPNPHGYPNSDVMCLLINGKDITSRPKNRWIVDFGSASLEAASMYELPFTYLERTVKPKRILNPDRQRREYWWRLGRSGGDWKKATRDLSKTIFTPRVSKHRFFEWFNGSTLPDSAVVGFASSQDFVFGLLHSRIHEVWARSQGTQVRERESGFRYTPTTCFDTFPFPTCANDQLEAISSVARALDHVRSQWLNPPEWTVVDTLEFPGTLDGPWARFVNDCDSRGLGVVRYPRVIAKHEEAAAGLARRTLTNLYNERPTWLDLAHRKLDEAVFAAYGWEPTLSDDDILTRLLALNQERAAASSRESE